MSNWKEHYIELKRVMLNIYSQNNQPYLKALQQETIMLERWVQKTNINQYIFAFSKTSLLKFNQRNVKLYDFNFDWCNIHEEISVQVKNKPKDFKSYCLVLYYISDFLLSYNSLINSSDDIDSELYYVKNNKNQILYESKFPPRLYTLDFKSIDTLVIDYCDCQLLKENGLLRE